MIRFLESLQSAKLLPLSPETETVVSTVANSDVAAVSGQSLSAITVAPIAVVLM